jgi:hypothetical protein
MALYHFAYRYIELRNHSILYPRPAADEFEVYIIFIDQQRPRLYSVPTPTAGVYCPTHFNISSYHLK